MSLCHCHYAEFISAESYSTDSPYAVCCCAESYYAESCYAESHYAECRYKECHGAQPRDYKVSVLPLYYRRWFSSKVNYTNNGTKITKKIPCLIVKVFSLNVQVITTKQLIKFPNFFSSF
jgi:hypothetical protein